MKKILAASALLAATLFWACHLSPSDTQDHFNLVGDSSWTHCDSVLVVLKDTSGKSLDTLFNDTLRSLSQLENLPVGKFHGGTAVMFIRGSKQGGLCFEQTRKFDDAGGPVKVDTTMDPGARPFGVIADPVSLVLTLGGPALSLHGTVNPSYGDQSVLWTLAGDGIVSMSIPSGSGSNQIKVSPERIGKTKIILRSGKDTSLSVEIPIQVNGPSITGVTLDKDSLILYLGGPADSLQAKVAPEGANQSVQWNSLNPAVAKIDTLGHVSPMGLGQTYVQAKSLATSEYASAVVTVRRDVPVLTVASKTGAAVNTTITFAPKSTQQFGSIVMYKWDLDGDGNWDDSLAGNWTGKSVDLDVKSAKYSKEGPVTVKFLVRDGEGNEAETKVLLDIGNQAPEILAIRADTTISIQDSIAMTASVKDVDGKVAWCGWDYDGDGKFDDSILTTDAAVEIVKGHRYPDAGIYSAILKVVDDNGKVRNDTVKIKVELDPPKADAGSDTTVTVGSMIPFHAKGTDKFGSIVKREIQIGSGPFLLLSKPDTSILALAEPGKMEIILRVTDDDGLTAKDTVEINVVLSANADLANLVFSAGPLDPVFKSNISNFAAHANYADSLVTLTPTAKDAAAHITVNATTTASGSASTPIKVQVGPNLNIFQVLVTAADGTQHVYNVSVVRDPSADATLSKLETQGFSLKPAFSPTTVDYADTVPNAVSSVTLKPTLAVPIASLAMNDSAMASGTATFPQPLQVGDNLFKVSVTSQSGLIKTVYNIKVVRLAQLFLFRSLAGKPATQTDSLEVPPNAPRTITSLPVTGYHFVKWTLLEGTAVLSDSNANPSSLTIKSGKVRMQAELAINKYAISAGANAGGSISPSGIVSIDYGQNQIFTISASTGNRLKSVSVDGSDATSSVGGGTYSFINVTSDHAITVVFVKRDTLATKVGAGGDISPANLILDEGSDTSFTVNPQSGFKIATFKVDGVDAVKDLVGNKYSFKAIAGNHLLEATFIRGFTLTGVAGVGGSITPTSIGVNKGDNQTFIVTPNSNYRTKTLLDNGEDVLGSMVNGQYTINGIDTAHIVGATFLRQFSITLNVSGNGTGTVNPGTVVLDSLASQTYLFGAAVGSRLTSIVADGISGKITGSYTFSSIAANHTLSLVFTKVNYPLTAAVTFGAGSITPTAVSIDSLGSQTFNFTPAAHYRFFMLMDSVNTLTTDSSLTQFTLSNITARHDLKAMFWHKFDITSLATPNGTITISNPTVDSNGSATVYITPAPGYRVLGATDNGKPVPTEGKDKWGVQPITLNPITANHVIGATFMRYYSVTATTNDFSKGMILPSLAKVDSLGTASFGITITIPNHLSSLTDNGTVVVPVASNYTVSNVVMDHKVAAEFSSANIYKLTVYDTAEGLASDQTSAHPKICVTLAGGISNCQSAPFQMSMDAGTVYSIDASSSVTVCNGAGCLFSFGFGKWVLVSPKGAQTDLSTDNPLTGQTINATTTIKAVYANGSAF